MGLKYDRLWLKGQRSTLWCCHTLTDKGNGRQTDRKNAYPVMEVVSVAVNVDAEVVSERIRTEQVTKKERSTNVRVTDV